MILITGGAGFIGLNFVKYITKFVSIKDVIVVDKLTYASNGAELKKTKVMHYCEDIADIDRLEMIFKNHSISTVFHFAAESHVDNSINDCMPFVYSNIIGTVNLLELTRRHRPTARFIHVSTDEVFGHVFAPRSFNEHSPLKPRNPYSASKASAEHFVNAYRETHKLQTIIVNSSNNYGPYQHTEKLIPKTISNLLAGNKVPVYGDGQQIRDWIYVEDTCDAIWQVYLKGLAGDRYCIGGDTEIANIDLVKNIIKKLDVSQDLIEFVADRPGHDARYYTDCSYIKHMLGWLPKWNLNVGLEETIRYMKGKL
jgi:dTDP-glucose 4,6-dehydratase